jgi:hypothetical protein
VEKSKGRSEWGEQLLPSQKGQPETEQRMYKCKKRREKERHYGEQATIAAR